MHSFVRSFRLSVFVIILLICHPEALLDGVRFQTEGGGGDSIVFIGTSEGDDVRSRVSFVPGPVGSHAFEPW